MNYFRIKYYYKSIFEIELIKLKKYKLLIIDLDNTLIDAKKQALDARALEFIQKVNELGIEIIIVSNNLKQIPKSSYYHYLGFALKPSKRMYYYLKKVINKYSIKEILYIGDQLFTDALLAKRLNYDFLLVDPLSVKDLIYTKLNRRIENYIKRNYEYQKM